MDDEDLPVWMHRFKVWSDCVQPRIVRRIGVAMIGVTVLVLGIIMIVLPGPSVLVIPAGLAILALEFSWARRWLKKAQALSAMGAQSPAARHARRWWKKTRLFPARFSRTRARKAAPKPAGDAWKGSDEELISAASGGQKSPP